MICIDTYSIIWNDKNCKKSKNEVLRGFGGSNQVCLHKLIMQGMKGWYMIGKISITKDWRKENSRRK